MCCRARWRRVPTPSPFGSRAIRRTSSASSGASRSRTWATPTRRAGTRRCSGRTPRRSSGSGPGSRSSPSRLRPLVSRRGVIEGVIRELASYERESASAGERRAAEWLAGELREAGCRDVRVEEERAHGGYWWPLGLLNAGSVLAALLGRLPAALVGGAAAAAVYDDVSGGRLWFRRRALPHRST